MYAMDWRDLILSNNHEKVEKDMHALNFPGFNVKWVTSCEDGNPKMATIDPSSGSVTLYTFPKPPHGGGYDDLYFLNGMTFIAASNPTLDSNGNNTQPAVDQITLSGGKAEL